MKPYSPASDRNRDSIQAVLLRHFSAARTVLEIGSGTGQHAVYFAQAMPALTWQCSDRASYLAGICQWLDEAQLPNTPPPLELDVATGPWPNAKFDAVFSANTLHIMSWEEVQAFFRGLDAVLAKSATLVVYGPFNYGGTFTSESNREFDASLRARDPRMGIRDFEAVNTLARIIGLQLIEDVAMPANNRSLVWQRSRS